MKMVICILEPFQLKVSALDQVTKRLLFLFFSKVTFAHYHASWNAVLRKFFVVQIWHEFVFLILKKRDKECCFRCCLWIAWNCANLTKKKKKKPCLFYVVLYAFWIMRILLGKILTRLEVLAKCDFGITRFKIIPKHN